MQVFSIYDSKAEAYLPPFLAPAPGVALRIVTNAASDPKSDFHRYGDDYTLFHIGEWDADQGVVNMSEAHVSYGTVMSIFHSTTVQQAAAEEAF
ncbi:nonstructural protein [Microviridae sp.]|nr:nonstructural protein [Microviridae sp.]